MKTIGLTGGIGSGKTTVAKMFMEYNIPVYIADVEAKKLMNTSSELRSKIIELLGDDSYLDGVLNRAYIANLVFNDSDLLEKLNAVVHPAVAKHFLDWKNEQNSPYVIKEAAVLFENDGYKQCDATILVIAPQETRIERVLKRDKGTRQEVLDRIRNQWDDSKKIKISDFVINNTELEKTRLKVCDIHNKIIK